MPTETTKCIHPDACRERGECMLFGCDRYPGTAAISHETTADRLAWFERLVAGAVAKMQALPEWKRNSLRAQIAAMGKSATNV